MMHFVANLAAPALASHSLEFLSSEVDSSPQLPFRGFEPETHLLPAYLHSSRINIPPPSADKDKCLWSAKG